jgi:hypothetical protein
MKNHAKSPISQLLEISPHSNYLQIKKIQMKSQLPSFSHTICDPTIHVCVCVCVCLSLSLSHALFHWGTQSQSFYLLWLKSYTTLYIQGVDQQQSKSSFCSHTNLPEKRPLWKHVSALAIFFLNSTQGRAWFTKWNFAPKRLEGVLVFHWPFHRRHRRFIRRVPSLSLALHWATSSVGRPGRYVMSGDSLGGDFPTWGWLFRELLAP